MNKVTNFSIILASQSPARLLLLKEIGIIPDSILPADIDETPIKHELPRNLAKRLAKSKALVITEQVSDCKLVIAADTVVEVGRESLPKALTDEDVVYCMQRLSGKRHRVYTGVCIIKKQNDNIIIREKLVKTILKFKLLTPQEIELYVNSKQGIGKAGGYSLKCLAEAFVEFISGSYSNVIGLPLNQTINMLSSLVDIKQYRKDI